MSSPLEGIKVLEFGHYIAGPLASATLVDLGAEVVKVEPPEGDPARSSPPFTEAGESLYFSTFNSNKHSVTLDLADPDSTEHLEGLMAWADVLITNYSHKTPEKLGFGFDRLKEVNPRAIMIHITGFGSWSRISQYSAYDSIVQAMSGMDDMVGDPDGPPFLSTLRLADHVTAQQAATAALAALHLRSRTGTGTYVEVSMLHSMTSLFGERLGHAVSGTYLTRTGNRRRDCFVNLFRTRDGLIVLSPLTDRQWTALCEVIQRPDFATADILQARQHVDDERFRASIETAIGAWAAARTSIEATETMQGSGVPCGPVLSLEGLLRANELFDLAVVREQETEGGSRIALPALPYRGLTSDAPGHDRVPGLGEDQNNLLDLDRDASSR